MTVKEYASGHYDEVLSLMTPDGFLRMSAVELLAAETVKTNPGCPGYEMVTMAADILNMSILDIRRNDGFTAMLVE